MKKLSIITLSLLLILLNSCALIFTGSKQKVKFVCNEDAKVYQNLTLIGTTNTDISIKRCDLTKLYTIKEEGCLDKSVELPVVTNPMIYADACFGILLLNLPPVYSYMYCGNIKTNSVVSVELDCSGKKKNK